MADTPLTVADLGDLARDPSEGQGLRWSLPSGGGLGASLYSLPPGGSVAAHVNRETDLVVVGVSGTATVAVDEEEAALAAGVLIHVPKGARRRIEAGEAGASFLTVHRAVATSRGRRGPRAATDEPAPQ